MQIRRTIMLSIHERFDELERKMRDDQFRSNTGLGNEVGYYVFDYDPEDDPDGEKKRREMSEDLLKRARFLVVCGKKINDDVKEEISIAKRSKVIPTTLEGVLECGD